MTNELLKEACIKNEFCYVSHNNINHSLLSNDGLHLQNNGIRVFANNLIGILNRLPRWLENEKIYPFQYSNISSSISSLSNLSNISEDLNFDLSKYSNNPVLSYININSIRNKLNMLSMLLKNKVGILAIAETKIDETFSTNQFLLDNYKKPYRLDKSKWRTSSLCYARYPL